MRPSDDTLVQDSIDYVASDSICREWSLRHWTILPVWELGNDPAGGCLFDQETAIDFREVLAHFSSLCEVNEIPSVRGTIFRFSPTHTQFLLTRGWVTTTNRLSLHDGHVTASGEERSQVRSQVRAKFGLSHFRFSSRFKVQIYCTIERREVNLIQRRRQRESARTKQGRRHKQ